MARNGALFQWLTLPPVIAVVTAFVAGAMGSPVDAEPVDPSFWGMTCLLFIVLSALYGLFIVHGFGVGLLPLQLVAQGILLCPLALSRGARMFQWVGVIMAVCGAVALLNLCHYCRRRPGPAAAKGADEAEVRLPVPFVVTDAEGVVESVSSGMLEAAQLPLEAVKGQSVAVLLTPGDATATLGGRTWDVIQRPMEGDRYYFQLSERAAASAPEADVTALTDPVTGLQVFRYAMMRLDEELYRTRRYGHPLTVLLIRLVFSAAAERDPDSREAFVAYGTLVRKSLRTSDVAALSGDRELMLMLPECPAASSDAVVKKMLGLLGTLNQDHRSLSEVTALHVAASFESTDDVPNAKSLVDGLIASMAKKYTLNAQ